MDPAPSPKTPSPAPPDGPLIRVRDLHKSYRIGARDVHALRGVDLDIEAGAVVFILGRSGSGKSTLLHLIGALDIPTRGSVEVGGVELARMSDGELSDFRRARIGIVFQAFNLIPNLTALENVLIPLMPKGISEKELSLASATLARVGLADRVDHRPVQLSGGEQQRVAIARAVLKDPLVLLADEPTGELDTATGAQVMETLRNLNRDTGTTIVIVTHDVTYVRPEDKVFRMEDGRLSAAPGSPLPPPG